MMKLCKINLHIYFKRVFLCMNNKDLVEIDIIGMYGADLYTIYLLHGTICIYNYDGVLFCNWGVIKWI